ncbi:MAG: rhamnogalacturonan lyase [Lachnospiraceae bacterium]|nr:rhamnogalacturonan lyase [Lachnospiraceae bacterium]
MNLYIESLKDDCVEIAWEPLEGADDYVVYWADMDTETVRYRRMAETGSCCYVLPKATHVPHYLKVAARRGKEEFCVSDPLKTPVKKVFHRQLEKLGRGLIAVKKTDGVFLSWRMLLEEVHGYNEKGLTGTDYRICRNGEFLADVTESTNYLDREGTLEDVYTVAPLISLKEQETENLTENGGADGSWISYREGQPCEPVSVLAQDYLEIPLKKPAPGVTPAGEAYEYSANDMSVGDVDGDGEYEYIVKWDPSNSHDVSIKGYTGKCFLDCYKLDGRLLWRLDMGVNIRAGAHYTQFMVYDFNGDGKAEMAVKTAPGTKMTRYAPDGRLLEERYVTMPQEDILAGVTHQSNFVCSAADYRSHLAQTFAGWREHPEVKNGNWPDTLEECFGIEKKYEYPLNREDALKLADYYIMEYAPAKDPKNRLDQFEGFIYEGPEYLTMFGGDGRELQTIPFKMDRVDDGLLWGDYAMKRVEPCNRVDRFLSGVAYLDGERPYLIICRGYYTRTTIVAYDFFENRFREVFGVDSGFVPMENPFDDKNIHSCCGSDPVYGALAGQGNHSLSAADVDGDGCMEIIYGAAVIDQDGSLLYSSYDTRPDGVYTRLGHGDAMHVAKIDPDRPGLQIFNVFEGGAAVPYGYALRDAGDGEVIFGKYATVDLGRCMIGKIDKETRGLQVWVNDVYDCQGNPLVLPVPGTNQNIRWAADLTTQVLDSPQYIGTVQRGVVNDLLHGVMLEPEGTMTNNGTKGNPCLVADLFGDFREELLLRTEDSSAIRIYTSTDLTEYRLFTPLQDTQYRCGIAWQNNCYNQPVYPSYYYASDMDFKYVLPEKDYC